MIRPAEFASGVLHRCHRGALRTQLFIQLEMGLLKTYQPNPLTGRSPGDRGDPRLCRERFEAFNQALPAGVPLSTIDIGCNLGYFTLRMAERGGFCLGVDYERHPIMAARSLVALNEIPNVAFTHMTIDAGSALTLPVADVVICMSVLHHWARKEGEAEARRIMASVASRARSHLVFDTGQSDEKGTSWADDLGFMEPDPDAWIEGLLRDLGFPRIDRVGYFATTVSPTPRCLYVASREDEVQESADP